MGGTAKSAKEAAADETRNVSTSIDAIASDTSLSELDGGDVNDVADVAARNNPYVLKRATRLSTKMGNMTNIIAAQEKRVDGDEKEDVHKEILIMPSQLQLTECPEEDDEDDGDSESSSIFEDAHSPTTFKKLCSL